MEFYYYCGGQDGCDGGTQLLINLYADDQDYISKTKLQIIVSLMRNGIQQSKYYTDEGITNVSGFFNGISKLLPTFTFESGTVSYNQNALLDGVVENNLNPLKLGSYFDGYKPGMPSTTGLNVQILNDTKTYTNNTNVYTYSTGNGDDSKIKQITNINDLKIMNTYANIYNGVGFVNKNIPLFNAPNLLTGSDGTHFSYQNETIYFYDDISARFFRYNYKDKKSHENLNCYM